MLSPSPTHPQHSNVNSAGGSWQHVGLAREEGLCYLTSLSNKTLQHYDPLPEKGGVHSPFVPLSRYNVQPRHGFLGLKISSTIACC